MLRTRDYFLIVSLLSMWACTAAPSNALNNGRVVDYTHCALPKDQGAGSLKGKWSSLPVPVVLDRDFYVTDGGAAVNGLKGAMQTWNIWASLKGFSAAMSLKNDGSGQDIPELSDCSQASYSSSLPDTVGIWKISSAGWHKNRRDACGTLPDGTPGKILANGVQGQTDWIIQSGRTVGASILLNFDDYNVPGKQHNDVESLLLHELGHMLGLLHSCNGSNTGTDITTAPACFSGGFLAVDQQYARAVMFPFLENDQIRRQLQQNDYNRVNCLY
jgi:hypothetical protein